MKNVTMIAAVGKNLELGKDNKLLWHLPEDLQFFKEQTMGKPIIMGKKTLDSLPRLLPGRLHLVLTHQQLEQMLDYSDKMILTEIDAETEADAYFPSFNKDEWEQEVLCSHEDKGIKYRHLVYQKKR